MVRRPRGKQGGALAATAHVSDPAIFPGVQLELEGTPTRIQGVAALTFR